MAPTKKQRTTWGGCDCAVSSWDGVQDWRGSNRPRRFFREGCRLMTSVRPRPRHGRCHRRRRGDRLLRNPPELPTVSDRPRRRCCCCCYYRRIRRRHEASVGCCCRRSPSLIFDFHAMFHASCCLCKSGMAAEVFLCVIDSFDSIRPIYAKVPFVSLA